MHFSTFFFLCCFGFISLGMLFAPRHDWNWQDVVFETLTLLPRSVLRVLVPGGQWCLDCMYGSVLQRGRLLIGEAHNLRF